MKKSIVISLVFNAIIVVLVIFSTFCSIFNFNFMSENVPISFEPDFTIFKYFTIDSNIFLGLVSAFMLIFEVSALMSEDYDIPNFVYNLKLVATTGVSLTMIVTICYLAPHDPLGYFNKFKDSNFFFHLVVPLLAIISFIGFEKSDKIPKKMTLITLIPILCYTIFYAINTFSHIENGEVSEVYDFYRFFDGGIIFALIVIPLMFLISYILSISLWFTNKKNL